ncbi:MAG: L-aspartate oxidase [Rhizobiaceae bacterium]|nr:L-aspartate oxidase [Rhizobiaceae bacterium]
MSAPVVVIGSGIGGLVTALALAPRRVALVTKAAPGGETSTFWAQGGIAAALGDDDSAALHLEDTLAAGDGLCDRQAAEAIIAGAAEAIGFLQRHGVAFDRDGDGRLARGLEAAHARRRILHAGGDATGAAVICALTRAVAETPSITVMPDTEVRRLIAADGAVCGLVAAGNGETLTIPASRVVIATGGLGGLYEISTNPPGNFGQGVMLAARAGALLADMEFIQFHPTALAADLRPLPLISEAVRGEGAVLVNEKGERFLAATPGAELAPRDVVARAIAAEIARGGRVYLDARQALGRGFPARFPAIAGICAKAGINPAEELIPVRPAEHYAMGGIAVDQRARTSVTGLWAVGECAATGLHGANRLASNSLLEAAVTGLAAARDIAGLADAPGRPLPSACLPRPARIGIVRDIVSRELGVLRTGAGLRRSIEALLALVEAEEAASDPALVALSIAVFAHRREESRGAHARSDFPLKKPHSARQAMTLSQVLAAAHALCHTPCRRSA